MPPQSTIQNESPPPLCNIEAEQGLLGALLVNNNVMLHIAQLHAAQFYEPVHQRLFAAMQGAWERGQTFTPITMRRAFDQDPALLDIGGGSYLVKLAAAAVSVINALGLSELVIDLAQRRALLKICFEARQALENPASRSATETAMALSVKLQEAVTSFDAPLFRDDYEVTEAILAEMRRDVQPYRTGYSLLDTAMEGGLYPGKSYGFAARKKTGKTNLAGSIACNLNLAGVRHLFICGEMSPEEIHKRTLARLMRVKQAVFNSREARTPAFMQRIADAALGSKRAMVYKNAPGLTFEELKKYVLLARMQKKITGFILDYWQLVGGIPKGKSRAEHQDEVAQWIADACRKYELWSITTAQINQEGNTRGGEGIRLAFDQVYILRAPNEDAGRTERWLEMSDTRYTAWRSVGSAMRPGFYLNQYGPHFSETPDDVDDLFVE
jgi:replicative DNA helicase